jgi:hypothetical protein
MGHSDPIETVAFKHEEGNEGEKIGVKRRIAAFYGGKLLKRQGGDGRSGAEVVLEGPRATRRMRTETAVQACSSAKVIHPHTLIKQAHDSKLKFHVARH